MYENYLVGFQKKKDSQHAWLPMIVLGLCTLQGMCQTNTEVYLVDLTFDNKTLQLSAPVNISNNAGYDNQPSFYNDTLVLYSSARSNQTDIAAYSINNKNVKWLSDTPYGGEYSPLKIPDSNNISAIRLDEDGTQLLYEYPFEGGTFEVLLKDLKVGYHVWYTADVLVSTVLVEDRMDLVVSDRKAHTNYTYQINVGRSLHRIPNTELVSFISKEEDAWLLKSINPVSGATSKIIALPAGVQDVCWLINGTLLAGKENTILKYTPGLDSDWMVVHEFPSNTIANITRMASNSLSTSLAFVAVLPDNN